MSKLLRREIFLLSWCFFFFNESFAQTPDFALLDDPLDNYTNEVSKSDSTDDTLNYYTYIPTYEWSIGIEHSYIPAMFTQKAYYPDNFEIAFWISQRLYMQAGIFFVQSTTQITQTDTLLNIVGDTLSKGVYFQPGYSLNIGGTLKLFLFKHAYFTPSLNLYFDKYSNEQLDDWSVAIGPTGSIEYFVSDRFSFRVDLFNANFGIGSSGNLILTTHRLLGLGLRYSFDIKRQE